MLSGTDAFFRSLWCKAIAVVRPPGPTLEENFKFARELECLAAEEIATRAISRAILETKDFYMTPGQRLHCAVKALTKESYRWP